MPYTALASALPERAAHVLSSEAPLQRSRPEPAPNRISLDVGSQSAVPKDIGETVTA